MKARVRIFIREDWLKENWEKFREAAFTEAGSEDTLFIDSPLSINEIVATESEISAVLTSSTLEVGIDLPLPLHLRKSLLEKLSDWLWELAFEGG